MRTDSSKSEYQKLKEDIKKQELILYSMKQKFLRIRLNILEEVLNNPVTLPVNFD